MFDIKRREFITLLGSTAVAWVLVTGAAHAQTDFPNRQIHMVVPYPAGGIVDVSPRTSLPTSFPRSGSSRSWSKRSRVQAATSPGTRSRVPFLGPATMANPRIYAKLRWSEKSFVPIGAPVWGPSALVVHPSLPVNTVTEFVDHVRKNLASLDLPIGP